MTEDKWLTCTEPRRMLNFLRNKASDRKFRLFACACCRQVWPLLSDQMCRAAVEQAERYADGQATKKSLTPVRIAARAAVRRPDLPYWRRRAFHACLYLVEERAAHEVACEAAENAWAAVLCSRHDHEPARKAQVALVHGIFGSPFRPVALHPAWAAWNGGTIQQLARRAYDERSLPRGALSPAQVAILADALEEAGCTDQELLGHLRGPGPHVRGCWVLDLLLGKQ